ncbi:PHP domain-containing protein [Marvinbryantia formatexigens]|nr:PHP domain-containing protein [Marvinbryantia formatexigens]UWO24113.1 PHP domain-containing protein [Marvinbryantia formatexigens DSM 14469]SDG69139.1 hypothetical protein SAMN05660368_03066 [Marvinbryantia formatexigens]
METVDLHVHSNCSDGTMSPAELVSYACEKGLRAFALTDHDTVAGLPEAFAAAEGTALEVVAGIEFSTEYKGKDIHIVGLDIDYRSADFCSQLTRFQDSRDIRNEKMIKKMQENGIDISHGQMEAAFGDAVWTRAHFARYLMDHGYVKEMPEAFERYIGEACPCFVPREKVTPVQAVHLISSTGGIPVLAHPMLYRLSEEEMDILLSSLKKAGLIGIEAIYSTHSAFDESFVRQLAKRHGLLISGGSDFHGSNKPHIDLGVGRGNLRIPYHILTNLRSRRTKQ